jgi:mRNA interferase RelE/StbE
MASFNIQWRNSTRKDLRKISPSDVPHIIVAVENLAENPYAPGSEKLTGSEHTYRIRVGDYRVVYEISKKEKTIEIQRVRHRKDVYRY